MARSLIVTAALLSLSTLSYAGVFSEADLCKAAIAVEMGRDVGTMRADQLSDSYPRIWYVRKDDGQKFKYRCRIEGNRIIWSTYFTDTGKWGRWRNNYAEGDAETTYSASGDKLTIKNSQVGGRDFSKAAFQ